MDITRANNVLKFSTFRPLDFEDSRIVQNEMYHKCAMLSEELWSKTHSKMYHSCHFQRMERHQDKTKNKTKKMHRMQDDTTHDYLNLCTNCYFSFTAISNINTQKTTS